MDGTSRKHGIAKEKTTEFYGGKPAWKREMTRKASL